MKETVPAEQAVTNHEHPLPPRVQEALGEFVGVAQEGLLALSVGVGLGVLAELLEEEVSGVVGPKGRHDADRQAVRHGHEAGEVTLGGRRVPLERPRVRAADGSGEVALSVYRHFADRDPLSRIVLERMLSDLVARGLDTTQGVLCVLDGSKALRKAVRDVLGECAPVQRCIRHKERNVLDHLPERDRVGVRRRMRGAWDDTDYDRALERLEQLAGVLERSHPGAAASLREGMAETLTLTRLGITGKLTRTLASTNDQG